MVVGILLAMGLTYALMDLPFILLKVYKYHSWQWSNVYSPPLFVWILNSGFVILFVTIETIADIIDHDRDKVGWRGKKKLIKIEDKGNITYVIKEEQTCPAFDGEGVIWVNLMSGGNEVLEHWNKIRGPRVTVEDSIGRHG